jgi:hypothetical protein
MTTPKKRPRQTECDECGKRPVTIHRIYHGHRYCGSCYARVFVRADCPKCQNPARLPRTHPEAICRACERNKPCIRCGKTHYRTGRISEYGPVCNACSVYFRVQEPCEACGTLSRRLSRITGVHEGKRICPACAGTFRGTCAACRRNRQLFEGPAEQQLCRRCLTHGYLECPSCKKTMPAGYGNHCEDCYWRGAFRKRMEINSALFQTRHMTEDFENFGNWMSLRSGYKYAALRLNRYACFLQQIERQWRCIPDADSLVRSFGPEYMRRHRLFTQWLSEAQSKHISPEAFQHAAESRQIQNLMDQLPTNSSHRKLAEDYLRVLEQRQAEGKTSIRSVRLALTPAIALLKTAEQSHLSQKHLNRYLKAKPGQQAALAGFIHYLHKKHGYGMNMPPKPSLQQQRRNIEEKLLFIMREPHSGKSTLSDWVRLGLMYFHGVPAQSAQRTALASTEIHLSQGITVNLENREYWLPAFPVTPQGCTEMTSEPTNNARNVT